MTASNLLAVFYALISHKISGKLHFKGGDMYNKYTMIIFDKDKLVNFYQK